VTIQVVIRRFRKTAKSDY